jgi:uncharacterized protein YkwD
MRLCVLACLAVLGGWAVAPGGPEEKPKPKKDELKAPEKELFDLLNKERAKEKLPPLRLNPLLIRLARAHSANMLAQNKMSHFLDGKSPADRAREAGYRFRSIGENIGVSAGPLPVSRTHENWMNSKFHRANILGKQFREVGVGMARNASGRAYYTQVFGTRLPGG